MRLRLNLGILICILLMTQTAFAYAQYAMDNQTSEPVSIPAIIPGSSDATISVLQHLIEVDRSNAEFVGVRETIIFKISGSGNYTTDLMAWIPDGAEIVGVSRQEMVDEIPPLNVQYVQEGNVVRFNDAERLNAPGMPPMYAVQYLAPINAEDRTPEFTKVLQYPTYINYPINSLIVKITPPTENIVIKDEGGNEIYGDGIDTNVEAVVHTWSAPQFKEFTVGTKSQININGIIPYIVIGFLILIVLAFPFVQKRMKSGDKSEAEISADDLEDIDEKDVESNYEEEYAEEPDVKEDEENHIEEPDLDELETRYDAVLSLLSDIGDDRDNGDISDDEYEMLSKKYKSEAVDLMKTIDELKEQLEQ